MREFLAKASPRPDVLIFGAECGQESRGFVRTARRSGIPCVLVEDGIHLPGEPDPNAGSLAHRLNAKCVLFLYYRLYRVGPPGTSGVNLIFVINEASKQFFASMGLPAERIRVVGSPEHDALAARFRANDVCDCGAVRQRLGLPGDRPVIFYAHQHLVFGEPLRGMVREMWRGAVRAGAVLLVKFHPRSPEDLATWRAWVETQDLPRDGVMFVRDECTATEALMLCAAMVTVHSTVVFDALVLRRPLVLIRFLDTAPVFSEYEVAIEVHQESELAAAVTSIIADQPRRQRLLDNFPRTIRHELHDLDGLTVQRTAGEIECLVASRRRAGGAHGEE